MAAATLNRWRGRTFKWKLVFWYLCSLLLMSTSWTVQIRNIWTYGSANGGSSSVQVSRKNIRMEKIFWYLGSIFSLDLVNVYLKNSANPKPMNGRECKWWCQLCTGGDDPQLQWRDSQEVDATCSSQPPARGPSLLREKIRSWITKKSQEQHATCSSQPPGSCLLEEKAKLFSLEIEQWKNTTSKLCRAADSLTASATLPLLHVF